MKMTNILEAEEIVEAAKDRDFAWAAAEAVGVPNLNPSLNKSLDFSKGANFAVGGTALLSKKERKRWNVTLSWSNSSLPVQLSWFKQLVKPSYKDPAVGRLKMESSLFMLGGGSADYFKCNASYTGPPINQKKTHLALCYWIPQTSCEGTFVCLRSGATEANTSSSMESMKVGAYLGRTISGKGNFSLQKKT
ncbi:GDSL esterase/lipase At1g28570 [Linum perenne]